MLKVTSKAVNVLKATAKSKGGSDDTGIRIRRDAVSREDGNIGINLEVCDRPEASDIELEQDGLHIFVEDALTEPLDRVIYTRLTPRKPDFDMVRDLMMETGVLDRKVAFEEYVDPRFAEGASSQTAWKYEPGSGKAE